jgi:ferritin-like metal-binding protein YciE
MHTLHDLFIDELKDIYSAERQLVKALPKMVRKAQAPALVQALREHLEQTQMQVERLDQIFQELDTSPRGKKCHGMEGLVEEGEEALDQEGDADVIDAGIIGAAQRVEHYEIAAYGTAIAHAKAMGHRSIEKLLQQTLDEEYGADKKLTDIAESHVNRLANAGAEIEVVDERPNARAKGAASRTRGDRDTQRVER